MLEDQSRADQVLRELGADILHGHYGPGKRLPSERDLAARFQINRGAVREALKKLEQLGVVAIRPGGARVVPLEQATLEIIGPMLDLYELPDPGLVEQLLEVHLELMSLAVRMAAERGSDEQLTRVRGLLRRIADPAADDREYNSEMHDLSQLLVEASHNLVLRLIHNGLKTQFIGRLLRAGVSLRPRGPEFRSLAHNLDAALAKRRSAAASRTARKLIKLSREQILKVLEREHSRTHPAVGGRG